ncbi:MAG: hypothetical protein A2722_04465 [Candidatus Doudnabacteria bacterium RIFCSPHIGHO2_01_FULL_50_11]|uniref:Cell shape determination protein CcmA n=1 Tax=Candidatus Doudnabacteria bacterium RIFCSPHIGHO2_01_FULL_50_11 TaxID=1817828 RepID=A0A1F5PGP1_9BACT|nr:MAG: hypothetical protein A2722_04465 [Candidatus Doudnabacteria bacterium RIFCSPHIGHO2_01_FULL_50_11]HLC44485.1 polymer-forming cytoskeletal protein [Patescibacteria group bacterium]
MTKSINVRPDQSLAAETIVGHSVLIEGDLVSEGDIKIDGVVHGSVKTTQNLFIGPAAKIEANIEAGAATIAGTVMGNIRVIGLISILQTGYLDGDVQCGKIAIEEGAYFNGACKMADRQKEKIPPKVPDSKEI